MKRILLFFAMMLTLTAISQTQTLNGVKTFTSPPKFKNLVQNNANTKVLTVNSSDVLQFTPVTALPKPSLAEVCAVDNTTLTTLNVKSFARGLNNFITTTKINHDNINFNSHIEGFGGENNFVYGPNYITSYSQLDSLIWNFPERSGVFLVQDLNTGNINFSSLLAFANNADALTYGLSEGYLYRTSTGQLMIVY